MKIFILFTLIFALVALNSGCFLDEILDKEEIPTTPPAETLTTINGTVNVPDAGASKMVYKKAPSTAKVYLLLSSKTWAEKLDYLNHYEFVTTVDNQGNYQFNKAVKGTSYCIIIDVNADGKCDELVSDIVAGKKIAAEVTSFVRELNTSAQLMLSIKLDKDSYEQGETIKFTVNGYVSAASDIHVEVWNESAGGNYIWASDPVTVNAGEVNEEFSHVIPVNGWPSTSTGVDYKTFAAIGPNLLASDQFEIAGSNAGDTDTPAKGTLNINGGAIKTGSLDVTLNISIPDETATHMIISNTSGDYKNSTWVKSAVSYPWTLESGLGNKTVYLKFSDASGNETDEFYDSIEYSEELTVTNVTTDLADGIGSIEYFSGSGTTRLIFRYTVQTGQTSEKLKYVDSNALTLNGGTISDAAGNNAILTLPAPGTANSLSANKAIVIDNSVPSGYFVSIDQGVYINSSNKTAVSFTFSAALPGATYNYSIDDTNGSTTAITGNGVVSTASDQAANIDTSSLDDGTLTLSVILTNDIGAGNVAEDTAIKDTVAPPADCLNACLRGHPGQ